MYNYVTCDVIKCFWDCTGEAYGPDVRPVWAGRPACTSVCKKDGRTSGPHVRVVCTDLKFDVIEVRCWPCWGLA